MPFPSGTGYGLKIGVTPHPDGGVEIQLPGIEQKPKPDKFPANDPRIPPWAAKATIKLVMRAARINPWAQGLLTAYDIWLQFNPAADAYLFVPPNWATCTYAFSRCGSSVGTMGALLQADLSTTGACVNQCNQFGPLGSTYPHTPPSNTQRIVLYQNFTTPGGTNRANSVASYVKNSGTAMPTVVPASPAFFSVPRLGIAPDPFAPGPGIAPNILPEIVQPDAFPGAFPSPLPKNWPKGDPLPGIEPGYQPQVSPKPGAQPKPQPWSPSPGVVVIPKPSPSPGVGPGIVINPGPSAGPRPRPGANPGVGRPIGGIKTLIGTGAGHKNSPPRPGDKDGKLKGKGAAAVAGSIYGAATEGVDLVDAMWDALPKNGGVYTKKAGEKTSPQQKAKDIYNSVGKPGFNMAGWIADSAKNAAVAQAKDVAIGKASNTKGANQAAGSLTPGLGFGFGPAL